MPALKTQQIILLAAIAVLAVAVAVRFLVFGGGDAAPASSGDGPTVGELTRVLGDGGGGDNPVFLAAVDRANHATVTGMLRQLNRDDPARHDAVARGIIERSTSADAREAAILHWGEAGRLDTGLMTRVLADRGRPPAIRAVAARAIGKAQAWEAFPEVRAALADDELVVRQSAFAAVDRMLAGLGFGYDPAAAPAERAAAIARLNQHPLFPPSLRENPYD